MGSEFSTLVNTNKYWTKCVLALIVHGKKALLRVFHNDIGGNYVGLPKDPAQLYNFFNQPKNRKILNKLKSSKTLKQDQFDLILPPNSNLCNSNSFDVTLIVLLVITFVNIPAPLGGWKKVPKANDQSLAAFVVLIRNLRNLVLHGSLDDFDEPYFKKIWKDIKDCLIGLQYDQTMLKDFDELLTNDKVMFDFQDGADFVEGLFNELEEEIKKKFDSNFKQQENELKKKLVSMKKDILQSALNTLNEVAKKRLEDCKLEIRKETSERIEDLRTDFEHEQDEMKDVQCKIIDDQQKTEERMDVFEHEQDKIKVVQSKIIDDQRKMEERMDIISHKRKLTMTEPSHTLHPSKVLRVEKITPKDVAFTTDEAIIPHSVQCWKIQKETKMKQSIKNITSTNINQKAWIQCEVDIKSGYTYEFVFNTDRADDSKITVQLPGNHHHTSRKGETLVYAHNCGRPSNIHAFEVSDENGI
uniref:DZIP3-like HEPN domain-containing protein n=2 Tax=Clytia hemisphaerica TaxID=252671 RepID=A0A7M5V5L0_9CNID